MSEALTFANFDPSHHSRQDIYSIGATEDAGGVIPEIARVFGYELTAEPDVDNLGGLIKAVGPAKELQNNISGVREVLGTDDDALQIARGWVVRSGLMVPVERYYGFANSSVEAGTDINMAVVTGGMRNWMARRALRLAQLSGRHDIGQVLLIGGQREMKPGEGKDVVEGMTEADYLKEIIKPQLDNLGIEAEVLKVDSEVGDEVMARGAARVTETVDLDNPDCVLALVSNAGAWVQNAGQMRRGLKTASKTGSFDSRANLMVASDRFKLGETGTEPTSTHQNPLTALGQVVRNAQELARHTSVS